MTKHASKRKRPKEAVPVVRSRRRVLVAGGRRIRGDCRAVRQPIPSQDRAPGHKFTLNEEEISDVSLGTFYVFDKETPGTPRLGDNCPRCGGCRGCGGGARLRQRLRRLRRLRLRLAVRLLLVRGGSAALLGCGRHSDQVDLRGL